MKVKDYRGAHHGYETKLDVAHLGEDEQEITILEYNKKYGIPKSIYSDTLESPSNLRPCAHCKMNFDQSETGCAIDPCYGHLEGVSGACCGHGDAKRQYINMSDDSGWKLTLEEYHELMRKKAKQ